MEIRCFHGIFFVNVNTCHACNHLLPHKISYLEISVENVEKIFFDMTVFCIAVKDYNQNSCRKFKYSMSRNLLKIKIENNSIEN